jgi:lipopolysaccharide transport protein LptA
MDEVEVGDLLDFRRSPDRFRARHAWPLRLLFCHLVAGGSLITGAAVAQRPTIAGEPIVINSLFSNIDYGTNTADFTDIVVSQGNARVAAQRASVTGVGFTNGQWTFTGRVVINLEPGGTLRADQAILQFRDGELTQVTAIGSPAYFEQLRTDSLRPAQGHADRITYDAKQDTVRLDGHAQLSYERNVEVSSPLFVYYVRDERLQADSPGERQGIHARSRRDRR